VFSIAKRLKNISENPNKYSNIRIVGPKIIRYSNTHLGTEFPIPNSYGRNKVCLLRQEGPPAVYSGLGQEAFKMFKDISSDRFNLRHKGMGIRMYYFKLRYYLSYHIVNHAILFEQVPLNFSVPLYRRCIVRVSLPVKGMEASEALTLTFIPSSRSYFNFLTCHGFKRTIPFEYYLQIFDSYIWLSVLLTVVFVSLFLRIRDSFTSNQSQILRCIGLKTIFYSISVILENGFESIAPNNLKSRVYRISYFILALLSLVIGNYYKAIFTMDITAPIPEQIQVQKISELKN